MLKHLLPSIIILMSCATTEESTPPTPLSTTIQYQSISGTDPDLLSLDIYYTDQIDDRQPVLIWVHGGGWVGGDKSTNMDHKINMCRRNGWLLVAVNYRLSPAPFEPNNPNRIMYPTHNNDVAAAIAWTYDNISQYGGDPQRIVLMGHSAGAHLVSLIGTKKSLIEDLSIPHDIIRGVISNDTRGYHIPDRIEEGSDIYLNAFGDRPRVTKDASPQYHISNGEKYPAFLILKRGRAERQAVSETFAEALADAGAQVTQINGNPYDHGEINRMIGTADEQIVTPGIVSFITEVVR